jgi:hypothetical protein
MAEEAEARLLAVFTKALDEKGLLERPRPRLVVPEDFAPERPCTTEIAWLIDQIRFLAGAYGLQWLVKQESRGYAGLESMPDDELNRVYKRIGQAIDCRKADIPFEDTDLIDYDPES